MTAIAVGLLVSALAVGGLLRADGKSGAIRSGVAGGPGERGRVPPSEAAQAEQVPVQVLVWKENVGQNVRYHYSISNGGAFRIATLLVGYDEPRLEPQLRKAPVGWTEEDAAPSGSTAPSGWEINVVSVEMDTVMSVRWEATLDGAKIPGGGALSGFSVVAPPGGAEYDVGGHWVVYLDSSDESYYAGTLKREGTTSAPPASVEVHEGVQVTPNPGRGAVGIAFRMPVTGDAVVEVFDASGRLVKEILRGRLEVGRRTVEWNGMTQSSSGAAAGTYFVRIKTPTTQRFARFVWVK